MSQHDLDIAPGRGIDVRADINDAIKALASDFSGPVAPTNPQPCMWWADTAEGMLKRRNSGNTTWINYGPIDSSPTAIVGAYTLSSVNNIPAWSEN